MTGVQTCALPISAGRLAPLACDGVDGDRQQQHAGGDHELRPGAEAEQAILSAREKTNWGPMQLQFLTGRHRSTIWKVLHRHGVSRQRRSERPQTTRRYEWAEAGALLHIDAYSAAKFDQPGHWATGNRSKVDRSRGVGQTVVIGVCDDHTRLAYCELHCAENAANVSATLKRAALWFTDQGCGPVQAVMSDG